MLNPCKHFMYCGVCADQAILKGKCFFCNADCEGYDRIYF
jgi:hypothetical protein